MFALALDLPGFYGARMTGGGFGGCTANLVAADQAEAFTAALAQRYEEKTSQRPDVYL
jgi:galactokinase